MKQKELDDLKDLCLCKNCYHKFMDYETCKIAQSLYEICKEASGETEDEWFKLLIRQCKDHIPYCPICHSPAEQKNIGICENCMIEETDIEIPEF